MSLAVTMLSRTRCLRCVRSYTWFSIHNVFGFGSTCGRPFPHLCARASGLSFGAFTEAFCYRDKSKVVHEGLGRFFNKKTFSDLTVVDPDGGKIYCHQLILSACSRRFAEMLDQGRLTGEELPVRGVDALGLYLVIRCFYTGECHMDHTSVIQVYDAAHRLDVPGLAAACDEYSQRVLGPQTACSLLQRSLRFGMADYAKSCSRVIRNSFDASTQCDDFLTIDINTLMRVLEDNIPHHSEGSIFRAAWRWGMSSVARMQDMPKIFQAVKVPNLRMQDLITLAGPLPGPVPARSCLYADMAPSSGHCYGAECDDAMPAARLREAQECLINYMLSGVELVKAVKLTAQHFSSGDMEPAPPAAPCVPLDPGGPGPYSLPLRDSGAAANQPPAPAGPMLVHTLKQQPHETACQHGDQRGARCPEQQQQQRPGHRRIDSAPSHPVTFPAMPAPAPAWQPSLPYHQQHLHQKHHHHLLHGPDHHQDMLDGAEADGEVATSFAVPTGHRQGQEAPQDDRDAYGRPYYGQPALPCQQQSGQKQPLQAPAPQETVQACGSVPGATAVSGTAGSREPQDDAVSEAMAAPAGSVLPQDHDLELDPGLGPQDDDDAEMHPADWPAGLQLQPLQQRQLLDTIKQLSAGEASGGKVLLVIDPAQLMGNAQHAVKLVRAPAAACCSRDKRAAGSQACQVDACPRNLTGVPELNQRLRICDAHYRALEVRHQGLSQRFCQQCCRFHPVSEFFGEQRTCAASCPVDSGRQRKRGRYDPAAVSTGLRTVPPGAAASIGNGVEANQGTVSIDTGGVAEAAAPGSVARPGLHTPQQPAKLAESTPVEMLGQPPPTSVGNGPQRGGAARCGALGVRVGCANAVGGTPSSICSGGLSPRGGRAGHATAGRAAQVQAQAAGQGQRQHVPHPWAEACQDQSGAGWTRWPSPRGRDGQQQHPQQQWRQTELLGQPQQQRPVAGPTHLDGPTTFAREQASAPHAREDKAHQHHHYQPQQRHRRQQHQQHCRTDAAQDSPPVPAMLQQGANVPGNLHIQASSDPPADPKPRLPVPGSAEVAARGGSVQEVRPTQERAGAGVSTPCPPAAPAPGAAKPICRAWTSTPAAAPPADVVRPAPGPAARHSQPQHAQSLFKPVQAPPLRLESSEDAADAPAAARAPPPPARGAPVTKLILSTVPLKTSGGAASDAAPVAVIQLRGQSAHKLFPTFQRPGVNGPEGPAGPTAPAHLPAPQSSAAPGHRRRSSAPSHMSTTAGTPLLAPAAMPPVSARGQSLPGRPQAPAPDADAGWRPPTGVGLTGGEQQQQQAPEDYSAAPLPGPPAQPQGATAAAAAAADGRPQVQAPGRSTDGSVVRQAAQALPHRQQQQQQRQTLLQRRIARGGRAGRAGSGTGQELGPLAGAVGTRAGGVALHHDPKAVLSGGPAAAIAGGAGGATGSPAVPHPSVLPTSPSPLSPPSERGPIHWRGSPAGDMVTNGTDGAGSQPQQSPFEEDQSQKLPQEQRLQEQQQQQQQHQQPTFASTQDDLWGAAGEHQRARVVALRRAVAGEQLRQLWTGAGLFAGDHQGGRPTAYGTGGSADRILNGSGASAMATASPFVIQQSALALGDGAESAAGVAQHRLQQQQVLHPRPLGPHQHQHNEYQHQQHHRPHQLAPRQAPPHAHPQQHQQPHQRHSRSQHQQQQCLATHLGVDQGGSGGGVQGDTADLHPPQGPRGHLDTASPADNTGTEPSAASRPPALSLQADASPTAMVGSAGTPPPPPPPRLATNMPLFHEHQGAAATAAAAAGGSVSGDTGGLPAGVVPGGSAGPTASGNAAVSSFDNRLVRELARGLRVSLNGGCSFGELNELVTPGSNGMFDTGLISPNTELFNMLNATNGVDDTVGPMLDMFVPGESIYDDTANTNALAGAAGSRQQ